MRPEDMTQDRVFGILKEEVCSNCKNEPQCENKRECYTTFHKQAVLVYGAIVKPLKHCIATQQRTINNLQRTCGL